MGNYCIAWIINRSRGVMVLIVLGILFMMGYDLQWYVTNTSGDTIYAVGTLYVLFGILTLTIERVGNNIVKEIKRSNGSK